MGSPGSASGGWGPCSDKEAAHQQSLRAGKDDSPSALEPVFGAEGESSSALEPVFGDQVAGSLPLLQVDLIPGLEALKQV